MDRLFFTMLKKKFLNNWVMENYFKTYKKTVIYDFRQNDLKNGGHGAPLTPIFHKLLKKNFKIKNVTFVNIGGIVNITTLLNDR